MTAESPAITPIPRPFHPDDQVGNDWNRPWGWTAAEAAEVAAVPPAQVKFWQQQHLYLPAIWLSDEDDPLYTLADVVALRCLRELVDAEVDAWVASAMVENLTSSYELHGPDVPDWQQPLHLDARAIAAGDVWWAAPASSEYIQAAHPDPNETAGVLVDAADVADWPKGKGRFRTFGEDPTWWAWPISSAAAEAVDLVELWRRRRNIPASHLGKWQ